VNGTPALITSVGPWIWFGHFERIMAAVDDLGCLELLD
jgi:hypothetical protein